VRRQYIDRPGYHYWVLATTYSASVIRLLMHDGSRG
jgi:hypothetical protein